MDDDDDVVNSTVVSPLSDENFAVTPPVVVDDVALSPVVDDLRGVMEIEDLSSLKEDKVSSPLPCEEEKREIGVVVVVASETVVDEVSNIEDSSPLASGEIEEKDEFGGVVADEIVVVVDEVAMSPILDELCEAAKIGDSLPLEEEKVSPLASGGIEEKNEFGGVVSDEMVVVDEVALSPTAKVEDSSPLEEEKASPPPSEDMEEKMRDIDANEFGGVADELAVSMSAKIEDLSPLKEGNEIAVDDVVVTEEFEEKNDEIVADESVAGEDKEEEESKEEADDEEMEDGNESSPAVAKHEESVEEETVKSGGKRKRGRAAVAKTPARKIVGEDVCFICLDGGDLVLCDRRGCPKAYHPSCVDHDEDFFKTKGRWNCGWHLCNNCGKNAHFTCYTCTFSLCKGCCKDAVVFCVRGNKGFCESCMKTVMMIENGEQNDMGQVAFDDKSSWEYLFKDYWIEQKRKLGITADELTQAKNPWDSSDAKRKIVTEVNDGNNDEETESDSSRGHLEIADSKRKKGKRKSKSLHSDTDCSSEKDATVTKRKAKRRSKSKAKEANSDSEHSSGDRDTSNKKGRRPRKLSKGNSTSASRVANEGFSAEGSAEWATKELLEFVMHMKDGDTSVLSQFDVQALLLEYIKRNKLRDPRRQSQIICDTMLQKLFAKPRVGHFEMLKLLESHFLLKEDFLVDSNHGSVVDDSSLLDADENIDLLLDAGRSKGKKSRKRGEDRGLSNLDDYAAIDMHNINLIYLRRHLIEALMEDTETFHDKIVGSFVRIRISGGSVKQDIYRLVQVIGTSKAAESYKCGKRTTNITLEIVNLDKTEIISIDTISNQEFIEDECKRLRQSIKCGLLSRMTVGDVLEKAKELQEVRVIDWLEAEIVRLSHLRDRASEKGRKKELRECVEKLQLLKTSEERQRRLEEIPEVRADPKMDPNYESEDESEMDNNRQVSNTRPRDSGFFRRGRDNFSSRKGGSASNDSWSGNARPPNKNWEFNRNLSGKGFSSRREDTAIAPQTTEHTWNNGIDKGTPQSNSWEKPRPTSDPLSTQAEYSGVRSDMSPVNPSGSSQALSLGVTAQTDAKVNEAEKIWHYRDPTGKVQGPFSMVQLRKWNNTGYFPSDLKIWKISQGEDVSIVLTEVLAGNFQKVLPAEMTLQTRNTPSSTDAKCSGNVHGSDPVGRYESTNLPSPTPGRNTAGLGGKQTPDSKWSSTSSSYRSTSERMPSPTPTSPSSVPSGLGRSNFSQQSKDSKLVGNQAENVGLSVANSSQFSSTPGPGPRPNMSLNSGPLNTQQIPNQSFAPPDGRSVVQGTGQNPPAYAHGWQTGFVARPEVVNNNMTHNPNPMPSQLPHGQWTGAPVANQAPTYGTGYPPNMPAMPSQNAWGPPANMPWGTQQPPPPPPGTPNMGWSVPPPPPPPGTSAFVPSNVGQLPGPMPGAPAMSSGNTNTNMGWLGSGPNPPAGTANSGWVAPPGTTGTWGGGDQNRSGGGAQWNRQSSFGSGGQRGVCKFYENGHCRKGSSCDYMHT